MDDLPIVIILNYHRIGPIDSGNPLHRLHTVDINIFRQQIDYMRRHGHVVSLEDIRLSRNLGPLNFAVTFDDVPTDALNGIGVMEEHQMPFALSVCAQLASDGWGLRDKVYCIMQYLDDAEIASFVRTHLPTAWHEGSALSFYHLTKRPDLDPELLRETLIEPLFAVVADRARQYLSQAYLSWRDLRERFVGHSLATLANHSWRHENLAAYSSHQLDAEIVESHDTFMRELRQRPAYFVVPFGRFTQRLALDLITPLQRLSYRGILWVGDAGNVIRGPYNAQIVQLARLHAPTTVTDFIRCVEQARQRRIGAAIQQIGDRPHSKPVHVIESSLERPALNYEMIMRQGKDYASDPEFYRYQFTDNPYKGERPDYYAVVCDGTIEATAYNFHASFSIAGQVVPGVYIASWRRLPEAHVSASGLLVRRMIDRECVVGVYKPNKLVAEAFRSWRRVTVYRHVIKSADHVPDLRASANSYSTVTFTKYDESFHALTEMSTRQAGFTVLRDGAYYIWRFDSYPLAPCKYFLLLHTDTPAGYCAVLWRGVVLDIADFSVLAPDALTQLVRRVLVFALSVNAKSVTLETSNVALSHRLSADFDTRREEFSNYYYLNDRLLAARGIQVDLSRLWQDSDFHETAATGDVLLR